MTKNQKTYLILGVGGAGLAWWWWRRSQGLSLIPNSPFSGGGSFPGAGGAGGGSPSAGVGGSIPIDDPNIVKLRSEQTGPLARTNCLPTPANRWINTTTGPYYGKCVPNDVFQKWVTLSGDVQRFATDATYAEFMRSIGR